MFRAVRYIASALAIFFLLALPSGVPNTLEFKVYREAYRDYFNVLGWMAGKLEGEITSHPEESAAAAPVTGGANESELVKRYLKLNEQIAAATPRASARSGPADPSALKKLVDERDSLEPKAQMVLREQVEEVLREEGFTSSIGGGGGVFPPLLFSFTSLPKILIISPRDRIAVADSLALKPDLTWTEAEAIEERESKLNVSALVVPIGGLGAYPPMIPRTSSLEFLAHTLPHEWAHNYFTFHPLGLRYSLQVEDNYEVVTMNETAASIIGEEVGDVVLSKYYGYPMKEHPQKPPPRDDNAQPQAPVESDFNKRMRAIRLRVDDYLAKGQVDEAEQYMNEERDKLQADGYDVRKLNQAYFAFYGSYATSPGFTNPLGDAVAELRYESPSLKAFVDKIGEMRSADELKKAIGDNP